MTGDEVVEPSRAPGPRDRLPGRKLADVASPAAVELGRRVRARRVQLGLSLEGLAEGTRLNWSWIGQVERGKHHPNLLSLLRLAYALRVDPAELVMGLPDPDAPQR